MVRAIIAGVIGGAAVGLIVAGTTGNELAGLFSGVVGAVAFFGASFRDKADDVVE